MEENEELPESSFSLFDLTFYMVVISLFEIASRKFMHLFALENLNVESQKSVNVIASTLFQ